jgi:hypothetical protein
MKGYLAEVYDQLEAKNIEGAKKALITLMEQTVGASDLAREVGSLDYIQEAINAKKTAPIKESVKVKKSKKKK